jgi:hypothetical protein
MTNRKIFQFAWAAVLVVSTTLACNFINNIQRNFGETRSTAVSVLTQAQGIITQAEGLATAFDESGAVQTAKALITDQGPVALATLQALGTQAAESGVLQTAQAILTEQGPEAQATLQALGTQASESGAMQTAQALVTQQGGDMLATIQALPNLGSGLNNPPEDIPLLPEDVINSLFATQNMVSFLTTDDHRSVISFYKDALPAEGWSLTSRGNLETDNLAILNFEKDNRRAILTVVNNAINAQTAVTILINNNP